VLDPPAFTKSQSARDGAIRGYKEINLSAMRLLPEGGGLVVPESEGLSLRALPPRPPRRTASPRRCGSGSSPAC
jgi:hypothetical protein